jgi:hypothetical protein
MLRIKTYQKLLAYFNGNAIKAMEWLNTPNSKLDGIKPKALADIGKEKELVDFIDEVFSK